MATYAYTFTSGDTVTPTKLNNARTVSEIVNADVSATAAITGTKIAPNFGSQNIATTGTAGIGTASPAARLEVFTSTGNVEYFRAGSSVSDRSLRFSSFAVSGTNSVGHDIKAPEANGTLTFSTVSSERVRITNTGAVCVGTTSPTADHLLHVAGRTIIRGAAGGTTADMPSETTMLSVLNGASYNGTPSVSLSIGASNYDSVNNGAAFQWVFLTPSEAAGSALTISERTFNGSVYSRTERLRVDSSGIAVAGDATISDKLIHAGDANTCVRFPAADTVAVETAGSERLRVDSSGNLGIGTTSPSHKLSVVGDINTTESFLVDSTKVVGNRVTGWGAPTGTISRSALTLTASATYSQSEINTIIQALKAVVTDLRTHGLIGN